MKFLFFYIKSLILLFLFQEVQAESLSKIKQLAEDFEEEFSIKIHFEKIPNSSWDIKFSTVKPLNYNRLYNYLLILHQEFKKYPKAFLKKTQLKEVALVYHLNIYNQYRAALPDYNLERLYFDFSEGWHREIYQRHVIHHEFFHMIEQEFNGDAFWFDKDWNSFNPANSRYGNGGMMSQSSSINYYEMNHPSEGFINLYSKSGLEEDKAEIFATLFVEKEYQKVSEWMKNDEVLKNKVEYMKNSLLKHDQDFKFY